VALRVGDFSSDGDFDLAVVNYDTNGTVSILLGNGNGTFQPPVRYPVGSDPADVAVQDLKGDGILDLVVSNSGSNTVSVLLGNGDGTFQTKSDFPSADGAGSLATGDFNGDGIPDIAVANAISDSVSVLLGNGDGTLRPPLSFPVGAVGGSVAVGDFNGDGATDLALTTGFSPGAVTVLLNAVDWTGAAPAVRAKPRSAAIDPSAQRSSSLASLLLQGDFDEPTHMRAILGSPVEHSLTLTPRSPLYMSPTIQIPPEVCLSPEFDFTSYPAPDPFAEESGISLVDGLGGTPPPSFGFKVLCERGCCKQS
jgi:hypothetical protein